MAVFSKRESERSIEKAILDLALAELARRGENVTVERHEEGYRLALCSGNTMLLANLTRIAEDVDSKDWPELVAYQVNVQLDSERQTPPQKLTKKELSGRVLTRLVSDEKDEWSHYDYARKFAPGIVQVLCVDYPQTVQTLDDKCILGMALSLDEMYQKGQINTDAELIDEKFEIDKFVSGLSGASLFIASKAGNFSALVPDVIGPAPLGVVFAIPNRSLLLYSVITQEDWLGQLTSLTQTIDTIGFDPDFNHPGGLISPYAYYWAPDGTVERIGGRFFDVNGKTTISLTVTGKFSEYVKIGGSDDDENSGENTTGAINEYWK